jgi:transposase
MAAHVRTSLAKRNTEHGSALRRFRWVVERTFAWPNQFRRCVSATRNVPIFTRHFCPLGVL